LVKREKVRANEQLSLPFIPLFDGGKQAVRVYRQHNNDVRGGQGWPRQGANELDELNAGQASVTNLGRHGGVVVGNLKHLCDDQPC
jgi:hypothetical protein